LLAVYAGYHLKIVCSELSSAACRGPQLHVRYDVFTFFTIAKNKFTSYQIGDILQTVASTPTPTPQTLSSLLASPDIIFKLVFLSVLSLAPILGRTHLRAMISISTRSPNLEEQEVKWTLMNDWRTKTAISAQRQQDQHSINNFSQEKSRD
jgi:hypothetical protein